MTARITRDFEFQAGIHFSNDFYMNMYDVNIVFNVETDSIREQNIALDRIKYFMLECLEHSIMCVETETTAVEKYLKAGLKVCTLPEEPYDQIIGIMLLVKLNAITEGRLVVTDIKIGSRMSDGVDCLFSLNEGTGPFTDKGWWLDSSTMINDQNKKQNKVVRLRKQKNEWDELGLGWKERAEVDLSDDHEVLFAVFDSKTDK